MQQVATEAEQQRHSRVAAGGLAAARAALEAVVKIRRGVERTSAELRHMRLEAQEAQALRRAVQGERQQLADALQAEGDEARRNRMVGGWWAKGRGAAWERGGGGQEEGCATKPFEGRDR